jgi:hypothetical protein
VTLDGLTVSGFSDPFEYSGDTPSAPGRPLTFDELDDPEGAESASLATLVRAYDRLFREPDVLLVHQNRLAQRLAETLAERRAAGKRAATRPLTIVTGDDHVQHIDRYGDIVVVDGGTVGAGGVFDAGRKPIGFARLHFQSDSTALESVDLIEVEPFSGAARASRVIIKLLCPESGRCSHEPVPLDPSSTAEP